MFDREDLMTLAALLVWPAIVGLAACKIILN